MGWCVTEGLGEVYVLFLCGDGTVFIECCGLLVEISVVFLWGGIFCKLL